MKPPLLMGILNVTPDSFSDGGQHFAVEDAVRRGEQMAEDGADWIDVGGESTRPGADPVSAEDEKGRVLPVIEALVKAGLKVSVDTMKPEVAQAALDAGAQMVNDVNALRAPGMLEVCAEARCEVCLMHMQGEPRTMQANPTYSNVVQDIRAFLLERASVCEMAGIPRQRIWIDPGIGFGKNIQHNLSLLKHVGAFVQSGYPVLVGLSRKSFIGRLAGTPENPAPIEDRLAGTLAAQNWCAQEGVQMLRVHDVRAARLSLEMAASISNAD